MTQIRKFARRLILTLFAMVLFFNTVSLSALATSWRPSSYSVLSPERFATYTSRQINDELRKLESTFPELITRSVIGTSVNGQEIYRMRLTATPEDPSSSGNPAVPGKPTLLVEAGTHARETANPYVAYRILANYARDARDESILPRHNLGQLLEAATLDFVILSNPDGYDLAKFGTRYLTAPPILSFLETIDPALYPNFKASATGVDLNRNFPAVYHDTKSSQWIDLWGRMQSGEPSAGKWLAREAAGAEFYGGPEPASEPETQALMDLVLTEDYRVVISLHSQGEVIYWDRLHLSREYNQKAFQYAQAATHNTGYRLMSTPAHLNYSGYFGDFVANETQKPSLTVETTRGSFPTPFTAFMEAYNRVATLPYDLAWLAIEEGYDRYWLLDEEGRYRRDMADIRYAQAMAERNGWSVWDTQENVPIPQ